MLSHSYPHSDDEIKDVPSILPETDKVIHPLEDNLHHEEEQGTVVKDVQGQT